MTASLRDQRRLHGPRGHHRIRTPSLPVSSLLQAGSLTMTLPTPSELPHPRCRQFCCRIVYRPSFSRGFKKANLCGVSRRSIPEWRHTPARFPFPVPFLSPYGTWAPRAVGTGNPQSPAVTPVALGIEGRRLSVDRGGQGSSIRTWTGRPRPWDPGARPPPDLVETGTTSVPYPVPSASLLPEGYYGPNKSPNPNTLWRSKASCRFII
jgi:hypothetical protein